MRILLHIGPDMAASESMQRALAQRRVALAQRGVLFARSPGVRNHTRLFMSVSDPDAPCALRHHRGYGDPAAQDALRAEVGAALSAEIARAGPHTLILWAHQFGSALTTRSELERLRALLLPFSKDITVMAHLDDPARMLIRRHVVQLGEGRTRSLALELGLVERPDWWNAALATRPIPDPQCGQFGEVQGAVHWLDHAHLVRHWDSVFGAGATRLFSLPRDPALAARPDRLARAFPGLDGFADGAAPDAAQANGAQKGNTLTVAAMPETAALVPAPDPQEVRATAPSAAWLARCRQFNEVLVHYLAQERIDLPRPMWRKLLAEMDVPGAPMDPATLWPVSARFADDIATLCAAHPGLDPAEMAPDTAPGTQAPVWHEADTLHGFRATQYLLAFAPRIRKAAKAALLARAAQDRPPPTVAETSAAHLPASVQDILARVLSSPLAPHNKLGNPGEDRAAPPYPSVTGPARAPVDTGGTVIVACMKNEAPYILEWIAHHRAIGVDRFVIYTNGCEDGSDALLDRLAALGLVDHRRNDDWTGKSPQQHALNRALGEPSVMRADWIIHIDVDEFINVRCGDGTLGAFLDRVPGATNIAMTWRLFGHNGVMHLNDAPVIAQFDTCAPKYCPKPHTVWGFKTMFRNIGAYAKLSCHRPNGLSGDRAGDVRWVNGSGQDMTRDAAQNGWRNSRRTIGYDLLQLNHYALRSADSFLVKRQRGRALHVDRSIGLNYWIRMDWNDVRDVTIQRNLPRLHAGLDGLLADPALAALHASGLAWHRDRARALRDTPEFADLLARALALRLGAAERVAYALALDTES